MNGFVKLLEHFRAWFLVHFADDVDGDEGENEITAEDAVTSDTSKATEKFSASPEPPSDGSLLHDIIASDSNDAKNKNFFICLISVRKQVSDGLSTPLSGSVPQLILNRIVYEYNMPAQEYCRQR